MNRNAHDDKWSVQVSAAAAGGDSDRRKFERRNTPSTFLIPGINCDARCLEGRRRRPSSSLSLVASAAREAGASRSSLPKEASNRRTTSSSSISTATSTAVLSATSGWTSFPSSDKKERGKVPNESKQLSPYYIPGITEKSRILVGQNNGVESNGEISSRGLDEEETTANKCKGRQRKKKKKSKSKKKTQKRKKGEGKEKHSKNGTATQKQGEDEGRVMALSLEQENELYESHLRADKQEKQQTRWHTPAEGTSRPPIQPRRSISVQSAERTRSKLYYQKSRRSLSSAPVGTTMETTWNNPGRESAMKDGNRELSFRSIKSSWESYMEDESIASRTDSLKTELRRIKTLRREIM